jgi:hypothetical protein
VADRILERKFGRVEGLSEGTAKTMLTLHHQYSYLKNSVIYKTKSKAGPAFNNDKKIPTLAQPGRGFWSLVIA